MSYSNPLLTYEPIRKTLLELEALSKGSPYEREAVWFFMDTTFRKLNSDVPDNIAALCKAEATQAFPNISEQEVTAIMKARNERIQTLTALLKADTATVIDGVTKGIMTNATEEFTQRFNDLFSTANLDVFLDHKLSQLPPSMSKAILESTRFTLENSHIKLKEVKTE
jgi:hypothetical protein